MESDRWGEGLPWPPSWKQAHPRFVSLEHSSRHVILDGLFCSGLYLWGLFFHRKLHRGRAVSFLNPQPQLLPPPPRRCPFFQLANKYLLSTYYAQALFYMLVIQK